MTIEELREGADAVRGKLPAVPKLAVLLGSGLDAYVTSSRVQNRIAIPYREIPHFPVSTVSYQKGELIYGEVDGRGVLFFSGRFHYYEGWTMQEAAAPVMLCRLLGIPSLILSSAVGAVNPEKLAVGDIVVLTDHIKFSPDSPDRGANIPELGERFYDMQSAYDKEYRALAHRCAEKAGFSLKEGVYFFMSGPQFETPAEIRALRILGADVVGMSTVAEVIEAAHCGIRTLALSCVTNMAAGVTGAALNEEEVLETGRRVTGQFSALLDGLIENLA